MILCEMICGVNVNVALLLLVCRLVDVMRMGHWLEQGRGCGLVDLDSELCLEGSILGIEVVRVAEVFSHSV
jgi:hypothetical protein